MSKTYLRYDPDQQLLLPAALQEWLPHEYLAYFISDVVDQLDLSDITDPYSGPAGPLGGGTAGQGSGVLLAGHSRELGMSRVAARKYALAESPPTNKLSAKERAKAGALAASLLVAN